MAKVLDKSRRDVLLKLTSNEYSFIKNILEFGEVDDNDFVFKKPINSKVLLSELKNG